MIISLSDSTACNPSVSGGKGSMLARLLAAGFKVPDGFIIPVAALDEGAWEQGWGSSFTDLLKASKDLDDSTLEARALEVANCIRSTPLPQHLIDSLQTGILELGDGALALRSSGLTEDLAYSSFAGQFVSILGVSGLTGVIDALRQVWASFASYRSIRYRMARGIYDWRGAVVVQKLVNAEVSGVAFSIDPNRGYQDRVIINTSWGLGEAIVSGIVSPDHIEIDRQTRQVLTILPGTKNNAVVLGETGVKNVVVEDIYRQQVSLNTDAISQVAELTLKVEEFCGHPVDIEWAKTGNEVYLLQARPITAIGDAFTHEPDDNWQPELTTRIHARWPLYSNGNIGEILPGCITPLTYSTVAPALERAFRTFSSSVVQMPEPGSEPVIVGFFYHRVYLNVSWFLDLASRTPGATPDTVWEDLVGLSSSPTSPYKWKDLLPWRFSKALRVLKTFLNQQKTLDDDISECERRLYCDRQRILDANLNTWSITQLVHELFRRDEDILSGVIHLRASQFANSNYGLLRRLTRRWLEDKDGSLAATLVSGTGKLVSGNPILALGEIALIVRSHPKLQEMFTEFPEPKALWTALNQFNTEEATKFKHALNNFLLQFGHRGFREAELNEPCWREAPWLVIKSLQDTLRTSSSSQVDTLLKQQQASNNALQQVQSRLKKWQARVITDIVASTQKYLAAREQMKDLIIRHIDINRYLVSELSQKLVAQGLIQNQDDVYFLTHTELFIIEEGIEPKELASLIARRRRDFNWSAKVSVPRLQENIPQFERLNSKTKDETSSSTIILKGLPIYPGVVEGIARVVLDPRDGHTLQPGEILVAPVTDVGWTPLYPLASALVVEIGGPLSHGAIVAREYGLPSIVAVNNATKHICSGDRIIVDASAGIVKKITI